MSIGISSVAVYRPEILLDNANQSQYWKVEEDFLVNRIGSTNLTRMSDSEDTTDLAVKAVTNLYKKIDLSLGKIDCLILVTQNPDNHGLPHASSILHKKLGLNKSCAVFDVSLGCSGYVQGLAIAKGFMESQGLLNGLLVTADPYSKIIDTDDRDTALLFGDAATATYLSDNYKWSIGKCDFGILSDQFDALCIKDGYLSMKGREVFNFAARQVPLSIHKVLKDSQLSLEDIDKVLFHQGSRFIVETLAKKLNIDPKKAPYAAKKYGNTVSSSIPIMLSELDFDSCRHVLISGFGVGLAWATCILKNNEN